MTKAAAAAFRQVPPAGTGQPELAYRDTGPRDAQVTTVLLHSLGTNGALWQAQAGALAGEYRVVVPDSRGHGRSGWAEPLTVGSWIDDLDRILDHAHVPRAWLVGLSMGGVQALAYAAHRADRVSGLVVADSFAELGDETAGAKIAQLTGQAEQLGMEGLAGAYVADTFTRHPLPPGAAGVREAIASMSRRAYVASADTCFRVRLTGRLAGIAAPALVLWGARDTKTPRSLSEAITARIPAARLEVIPAAGHLSNLENPGGFTAAVRRFLPAAPPALSPNAAASRRS